MKRFNNLITNNNVIRRTSIRAKYVYKIIHEILLKGTKRRNGKYELIALHIT